MTRVRGCVLLFLLGLAVSITSGAVLTAIVKGRAAQDRAYCANHLRQLGFFAALPPAPRPEEPPNERPPRNAVPPGTIVNLALAPEHRLSWAADALLVLERRPEAPEVLRQLDRTIAWNAGPNAAVAANPMAALLCPGRPATTAVTQYVGSSGLDPGGAEWSLGPPVPPRAGCFRYDEPTPYDAITDGLSNTILFCETDRDLGPWLQGGPATVRGLVDADTAPPPVGIGGQFGGNHVGGGNFGFVDGSVRFLSDRVSPSFFRELVTIAGEPIDDL
jgi:prepilin-type processing-associated H-X9-DG protein